jgi:hypothetical protein
MQLRDDSRSFADGAADPLDRARPCVAHGEHTRHIRFEQERSTQIAVFRGAGCRRLRSGADKALFVERDTTLPQPFGRGIGAGEQKNIADRALRFRPGWGVPPAYPRQPAFGRGRELRDLGTAKDLVIR